MEAFAALLHRGLPCAGVTGGGDPEAVVGALTLNDLRGLGHDKFGILALPVGEYLALKHGAVWSSAGGGSAHHASPPPSPRASSGSGAGGGAAPPSPGAPTRRDTLLQKHTLVALQPSATFREVRFHTSEEAAAQCGRCKHSPSRFTLPAAGGVLRRAQSARGVCRGRILPSAGRVHAHRRAAADHRVSAAKLGQHKRGCGQGVSRRMPSDERDGTGRGPAQDQCGWMMQSTDCPF